MHSKLFGDDDIIQLKIKAHQLYDKYIKSGAEFECNLSDNTRSKLNDLLENDDKWMSQEMDYFEETHLVAMWDDSILELVSLLRMSKQRFHVSSTHLAHQVTV